MNKRDFLKTLGKSTLTMAAMSAFPWDSHAVNSMKGSKNWMWIRPEQGLSADTWKQKLSKAKEAGIDAILVEVYHGTNEVFFDTDRFEVKEDILSKLIPVCKEINMELHAWMWSMPCNNKKIIQEHPDWYAVNGLGESASTKPAYVDYYKFLCPNHPEVQDFVQANVRSLASFTELDGVHLDYIRLPDVILAKGLQPKYNIVQDKEYPQYDYCYSEYSRQLFKEQSGIDPLKDLKDPSANDAWRQFRYDSITRLVNTKLVPEAKKTGKMITAAVFPNWESVRQQWGKWDLDAFLPMLYHNFYEEDIKWIKTQTKKGVKFAHLKQPVYSGLFVPSLSPEELKKAIQSAHAGGAKGISLFDYGSLKEEHWKVLAEMYKNK